MRQPSWTDVAGTVAAIAAAMFAGAAWLVAYRQLRQVRTEARQQHATRFVAWSAGAVFPPTEVWWVNAGHLPMFGVRFTIKDPWGTSRSFGDGTAWPTATPQPFTLPPDVRDELRAARAIGDDGSALGALVHQLGRTVVAVHFRDAANVWWQRDFDGVLRESTERARPKIQPAVYDVIQVDTGEEDE